MLNKKKVLYFGICILIVAIFICVVKNQYTILTSHDNVECSKRFGIIDGNLSYVHNNVQNKNYTIVEGDKTHGDEILEFLQLYSSDCCFYYYDVEEEDRIDSKSILDGLKWMLKNDVNCVSISLSSKYYYSDMENWLNKHSGEITVYASYNNHLNTLDYPAKYNRVIGVGSSKKIEKKENDIIFKNNKVILFVSGIKYYKGNSVLTPYAMVRDNYN